MTTTFPPDFPVGHQPRRAAAPGTRRHGHARHTSGAISKAQLQQLREMLQQQLGFRTEQVEQLRSTLRLDTLSSAEREISESLLSGARSALHDVADALRRMDADCYGRCRDCGSAIALARLEILPQVAVCLPCQRAAMSSQH